MDQLMERLNTLSLDTIPEEPEETADVTNHPASRRDNPSPEVYQILANFLVTRRQHRTCAKLNATNRSIFRVTLPILFRVVTLRYGWSSSNSLESWMHHIFHPLKSSRGARYIQYLIDETFLAADMLVDDFLEIRAKRIESIIRLFLPSVRFGALKATVSDIHGQIYVWIHEAFDYQQDFVTLFQGLFGVTFTEMDLRFHPMTVFRHDRHWTWLTIRPNSQSGPVFRIRWEASDHTNALRSADGVVQAFRLYQRRPLENLDAIFIETLNSLASLSRSNVYLSGGVIQFPALEVLTLSVTQLTRILREWAAVIASDEYHACVRMFFTLREPINLTELREIMYMVTPAYIAAARRNMNTHSGLRLQIDGPHGGSLPDTLIGEIHINFEEAHVQWYCFQQIRGRYVRLASTSSWPITVAVTPPDISWIAAVSATSIGEQGSDALELPPDVCVCVAQWLTDCDLLETCASLNATSRQVQFATLPALYRVLVWVSFSWETTSLNRPTSWDLENMREYGDEYWQTTRMWRRMINGPGAKFIQFILDIVCDFPHVRLDGAREQPAIAESIAIGALPRLKATLAVAQSGYTAFLHAGFSFGSTDIFSLVACLDRMPHPPSCYSEGYQLVIKRCRRAVLVRIGQGVVAPSLQLIIYCLKLDFVEGITTSKGDDRYHPGRLAQFYDAAVGDALMILFPRLKLGWSLESGSNNGRPCYLHLEVPNVQEAKLVAFSLARAIQQDRLHALVEARVHVAGTCTVDEVHEILTTLAPVYLRNAPWLCGRLLQYARVFRVTGFFSGASGSLTVGVRAGLLELRIRQDTRIVREDSFEFEPEPVTPGAGFFVTRYTASPFLA